MSFIQGRKGGREGRREGCWYLHLLVEPPHLLGVIGFLNVLVQALFLPQGLLYQMAHIGVHLHLGEGREGRREMCD